MVSVPKLQKIQRQPQQRGGRVQGQAPDTSGIIRNQTGQVKSLLSTAEKAYTQVEDGKINQLSEEATQKHAQWSAEKLIKLKQFKGNPTDAYAKYEEEEKEFSDKLLSARPDVTERVKRHLGASIAKNSNDHRIQVIKQKGFQEAQYNNNLFESSLKLRRDAMPLSAGNFSLGDPSSIQYINSDIVEMKTLISKKGVKEGTVEELPADHKGNGDHSYKDADGVIHKFKMSNIAKSRVAKEVSDGLTNSIKVLIDNNKTAEAQAILDLYGKSIEGNGHATIEKKFEGVRVENAAYSTYGKMQGKDSLTKSQAINNIRDPEIRQKVRGINASEEAKIQAQRDLRAKQSTDTVTNMIFEKMNTEGVKPFYGFADLEKTALYKAHEPNLTSKDKERMKKMIVAPSESASGSLVNVNELFFSRHSKYKVETIKPQEFERVFLAGLSKADRTSANSKFRTLRTESAGQQRSSYKDAGSLLYKELVLAEKITENKFGKLSPDDKMILYQAEKELSQALEQGQEEGTYKRPDLRKLVDAYMVSYIKGDQEKFVPETRRPDLTEKELKKATKSERQKAKEAIYKETGSFPSSSDPEYKKLLKSKGLF